MNLKTMILMVGIVAFVSSSAFSQDTIVKEFFGSGGRNTRPFSVEDGWEIQWDAKGDIFQLFLYTANGDMEGVPANQQGSGKGSSYQGKGGQYYLQVNAIGNWAIEIVQIGGQSSKARSAATSRNGIYVAYANGIVKDTKTGLEWKVGPDKDTNWYEAKGWVERLNLDGVDGGGWRMPTIDELKGLYKKGAGKNNMISILKTTGGAGWAAGIGDTSKAGFFDFSISGLGGPMARRYDCSTRAFAVRSGRD